MEFAVEKFGGIDILSRGSVRGVRAGGRIRLREALETTLQGELDLVFLPCRAVWRHMVPGVGAA